MGDKMRGDIFKLSPLYGKIKRRQTVWVIYEVSRMTFTSGIAAFRGLQSCYYNCHKHYLETFTRLAKKKNMEGGRLTSDAWAIS